MAKTNKRGKKSNKFRDLEQPLYEPFPLERKVNGYIVGVRNPKVSSSKHHEFIRGDFILLKKINQKQLEDGDQLY